MTLDPARPRTATLGLADAETQGLDGAISSPPGTTGFPFKVIVEESSEMNRRGQRVALRDFSGEQKGGQSHQSMPTEIQVPLAPLR